MGIRHGAQRLRLPGGLLTLRRRPWKPGLAAWIAVGISATVGGMLLGVAADKMLYESYGIGGWLQWGALLAAGIASPLLCAHAAMSGRSLPTFLDLLGPRDGRTLTVVDGAARSRAGRRDVDRGARPRSASRSIRATAISRSHR